LGCALSTGKYGTSLKDGINLAVSLEVLQKNFYIKNTQRIVKIEPMFEELYTTYI
jgi:hypothetical protein